MADSPAIEAEGLIKRYGSGRTAKTALTGLDLTVERGEVFGFLGPNGAGKTTTIRLVLDLIRPTSGRLAVLGGSPRDAVATRARMGYLAGDFVVNGRQTGRELLTYLGRLRGGVPAARIDELAGRLDLDLSRRIGSLSKGNRQKVGVVQAFMHSPELLILDEPTSGLDPFLQQQFVELVQEASANGQTVFMSSHVLSEVQQTCHRVGIIRDGSLVTVADVDQLREQAQRRVELVFATTVTADDFAAVTELRDVTVTDSPAGGSILRGHLSGSPDSLIKAAARYDVTGLLAEEPELEELFFSYYERGAQS
ncbi:ABC-2 type transport system ATP-binding protein [Allocatelliglobosispora scoriae]|uniref:ABC-2 type transport system ATP-binding protein n=1 Tax=Allocatelliglobosispora scoriae TaxID=643052 RepID=A0A841BRX3_9ACTN|nr:ABC transporter ATP-binding protein [Allocatelliglobosispora scoriae]MBB5869550.1 ABC-2 type transport system ATP-binding protein [Allocatelliglobosispora scoriae]